MARRRSEDAVTEFQPLNFWAWVEGNPCEPSCECGGPGFRVEFHGTTTPDNRSATIESRRACQAAEKRYEAQKIIDRDRWNRWHGERRS
jgi:hypothetical protein